MTGRFIAFEGGEGAGKSTQIARLAEALKARGETVVVTREPGGTPGAEEIRALFVQGATGRWTVETDVLLVTAARADHVARLIRPALEAGRTVLCDRFVHSTLAYQGHGKGVPLETLLSLHAFATGDLWPDLVLWLDVPVELGLKRSTKRAAAQDATLPQEQRFEQLSLDYHRRVHAGFAAMAEEDPRFVRIDATAGIDAVTAAIAAAAL
ncbi:dTMP kinase [Sandaracinobacter sp. RS1-74]|uniref:dTMP kinase n=1 Tax=Sandaracinobacteroides sayramensis TaxID=2913411 RepID=UPI001EDB7AB5|nr:dTMP kinase [Sandaracinobacteroides sayramensis]